MRAPGGPRAAGSGRSAATGAAVAAFIAAALLCSCVGVRFGDVSARYRSAQLPYPRYPSARFAVFSDPHLYDAELGVEGSAFQRDMDSDRKLLPESREILSAAINRVSASGAGFLLIPGDLTKDGERQDHLLMAAELAALSRTGVHVYVVPGNHDVLNPHAVRYDGSRTSRVPNVTPAEFAQIYRDAGYGEAIFRDPGSLSYVAEPVPGLWLLAVDSANYADNAGRSAPETGSGLTQFRVTWIESMLGRAVEMRKAVIVMLHHGIVEHFAGQSKYFPRYLLDDWRGASDMLAACGVRVAFTGHFHAQDVAMRRTAGGAAIFDVETGSLVTFPDPVRLVTIDSETQQMSIESSFIQELPSFTQKGADFREYSREFVLAGATKIAKNAMKSWGISDEEAEGLAAQVAAAFAAHFRGDEKFTGSEMIRTRGLSPLAGLVVGLRSDLVSGLWHDTEPPDNDLVIDLAAGTAAYAPARANSSSASFARGTVSSGFTLYQAR
jgi:Calcineurin-like phosphoesterase